MLNIQNVGNFSYHKSLLELMVLVVHGSDALDDKRGLFCEWENHEETHRLSVDLFYQNRDINRTD